jgi:hypothetical protein
MPAKIFCPVDGSPMEHTGDQGIVDYDGNWEAQSTRYECADGKHTIFVIDSDAILELPAFEAADTAISTALMTAVWQPSPTQPFVRLKKDCVLFTDEEAFNQPIKSLDDLRDELAKRAVNAFKDEVDENPDNHNYENVEYEYIHAIEDVDEVLAEDEFKKRLKELGWLAKEE